MQYGSEFEAFGCTLDTGGGAGREVCNGRDGQDSWEWIYNSDSTVARPGIYGNVNHPCPRASPSDSGRFTAINP